MPTSVPVKNVRNAPPRSLTPGDPLPKFRADLKVSKKGAGLFEVEDPQSGKKFTLYDFELSLARLLNGGRNAGELVDEGVRLGIPVTLETLPKFLRQLKAYGF